LAESFGRLTVGREEEPVNTRFLTANFFNELGAVPKLGRLLFIRWMLNERRETN